MKRRVSEVLLALASLVVLIAGIKAAAPLLVPFVIAVFLAILSLPLLRWLRRRRVPDGLAVTLAVLANLAVIGGVIALVSGSVSGFVAAVPRYRVRLQELVRRALDWLQELGLVDVDWVPTDLIDPTRLVDLVTTTVLGLATVMSNLLLVVLIMIFLLLEAVRFPTKLQVALGGAPRKMERYEKIQNEVQRYLVMKTFVSMVTGVVIGICVWLLGLDFPLLWGLLAFLFNYIPNIGSIIAAIPPCLLALIQLGLGGALVVALVYLSVNFLLGNLIEPQLMGRRLGLSPLVIFLALVFWGWAWGPAGMILSVPLMVIVRITLENSPRFRWVAQLLAARPAAPTPTPTPTPP